MALVDFLQRHDIRIERTNCVHDSIVIAPAIPADETMHIPRQCPNYCLLSAHSPDHFDPSRCGSLLIS
jgi:hypothetical protein